jgi:hypothetical protein
LLSRIQPEDCPDVLVLDLPQHEAARVYKQIASMEAASPGGLPTVIIVVDLLDSAGHQQSTRVTDALLVRPVTSSSLFNAINSAIWRRGEDDDRALGERCPSLPSLQARCLASGSAHWRQA